MKFPELIPFARPLQKEAGTVVICICSFWEKKNASLANGARNLEN